MIRESEGDVRRLTIMLSGGLGDCLLASPFIRHFHESGLYDHIVCALPARAVQLYECDPRIRTLVACTGRDLWLWGLPESGGDVFAPYAKVRRAVGNGESGAVAVRVEFLFSLNQGVGPSVRQVAAFHGIELADERPEIVTSSEDEAWAEATVWPWRNNQRVFISYRSPLSEKEYPLALWQVIVNAIRRETVVLEVGEGPTLLDGTYPVSPLPTLRRFAALVRRCDCVISIDSFAGHIAAATGTPSVVLFGPTNPDVWGHPGSRQIRSTLCPVCADTPRLGECGDRVCMRKIPPATVIQEALNILKRHAPRETLGGSVKE